jgi:hypothetical protein
MTVHILFYDADYDHTELMPGGRALRVFQSLADAEAFLAIFREVQHSGQFFIASMAVEP